MKDFGYDVSDYRDVDPLFGSLTDFDAVLARAHQLGLKLIIDQVWSHTSDQHPWFVQSAASRENKTADWYVWADAKADGSPPNNWQAVFGGASWTWSPRRRQYYFHNFLTQQPDLNYWNPEVQDAILEVARFWLDRGVDGFRLDVINFIVQDQDLRDNPPLPHERTPIAPTRFQRHIHDRSQPSALAFLKRLRGLVDGYDGAMTVGEIVDNPPLARQQEYTVPPDRLHTAYSFYLLAATRAPPELFAHALRSWNDAAGWPSWSLGNHDVDRFASRLAHSGDPNQTRILLAVLLTLRGTIFLYQGDELGLPQATVPFDRLRDPFAVAAYTGKSGRDGARTPMPWTPDGANAGFSSAAQTWLPVDDAHRPLCARSQEADPASTLHFVRKVIALRKAWPALKTGTAKVVPAPPGVLAFERKGANERLLCLFELSGERARVTAAPGAQLLERLGEAVAMEDGAVQLPPFGGAILRLAPDA